MPPDYTPAKIPFTLPPELEDLKKHARHIVERECIPVEAKFLSNK